MIKEFAIKHQLKSNFKKELPAGDYNQEVLFLLDEKHFSKEEIKATFNKIFGSSYKLNFIHFTSNKKIKKEFPQKFFSKQDFNFIGQLRNEEIKKKANMKYEHLFHFYPNENIYLNLIATQTPANLRIGMNHFNQDLIHIQLNLKENNLTLFFEEALKYLEIIKKSA